MFLHHVLFIKSNFDRLAEIDNVVMGSFGIYTTPCLVLPWNQNDDGGQNYVTVIIQFND